MERSSMPGWYPNPDDPASELFWNGSKWTGHGWYPDPNDAESRIYWDGCRWTGDRRLASVPPFVPPKKTDWAKLAGVALGAAVVATATMGDHNARRQARRASFASDWDLDGSQRKAHERQRQYNDYVSLYNNWQQTNWNNPNPPPGPMPPTY
jgi:hypothetical protein